MRKNCILLMFCLLVSCKNKDIELKYDSVSIDEFKNPPAWAKPKTWMHSMSGNMSKEGFTKDLEAISDAGIGGVFLFSVSRLTPSGDVKFASKEHFNVFRHAASECERLGLEFGLHNCDGWTASGGPWNTPENSMKMVVSKSMVVNGGNNMKIELPTIEGRRGFYKDVAVIAYPALDSQVKDYFNRPVISSNCKDFDIDIATDGWIDKMTALKGTRTNPAYVQFSYDEPFELRRVNILLEKAISGDGTAILSTSEDGVHFTDVRELKIKRLAKREQGFDDLFSPIVSKHFRITIYDTFQISDIHLSSTAGLSNYLERISLFKRMDNAMPKLQKIEKKFIINSKEIRNLSSSVDSQGILHTSLPEGKWIVSRFGFTSTGYVNSPASREGVGLEVDKMSREALKIHYDSYVGKIIRDVKKVAPNAMKYVEVDSYEVGGQNWTSGYEKYFKERYDYDLLQYLPLYTGLVIDSPETSERILSDIRRLNSNLITENYFKYFTELCHQDGVISYIEPYSINGPFCELDAAKHADVPMGEFWLHQRYVTGTAVSGAHIYGKRVVSSEAFSARSEINWKGHPGMLKNTGDKAWCLGINEFTFHRYTHQPNTHVIPGMTMDEFGSHIDRNQTWWNNAGKAWFEYIARGQYMLSQGVPVSDLLVFVGEGAPSEALQRFSFKPSIPNSINYDCVNADALCNRFKIKDGHLVLPEGTSYKYLALYNVDKISLDILRKLNSMSENGLVIIGKKPIDIIGFKNSNEERDEFNFLVESIWSRKNTFQTFAWEDIMAKCNDVPDLLIENGVNLNYTHRRLKNADIYFFYNPDKEVRTYKCNFRVSGKQPELWKPMDGSTVDLMQYEMKGNTTSLPVTLNGGESTFVVFSKDIAETEYHIMLSDEKMENVVYHKDDSGNISAEFFVPGEYDILTSEGNIGLNVSRIPEPVFLEGDWMISFNDENSKTIISPLMDWTNSDDDEIKYYSGTATYKKTFEMAPSFLNESSRVTLSLGKVNIACRVNLNDNDLGVLWHSPYELDVTEVLKSGENKLEIEVTNLWTNRLIGDERFPDTSGYNINDDMMPEWYRNNKPMPEGPRKTFTTYRFYKTTDELMPSGLVGPVSLISSVCKALE